MSDNSYQTWVAEMKLRNAQSLKIAQEAHMLWLAQLQMLGHLPKKIFVRFDSNADAELAHAKKNVERAEKGLPLESYEPPRRNDLNRQLCADEAQP